MLVFLLRIVHPKNILSRHCGSIVGVVNDGDSRFVAEGLLHKWSPYGSFQKLCIIEISFLRLLTNTPAVRIDATTMGSMKASAPIFDSWGCISH
jgi:hypothetical protein